MRTGRRSVGLVTFLLALMLSTGPLAAQEASPEAGASMAGMTVVASGLTNPRGFTWDDNGSLYVALAGSGGVNEATEEAPTTQAIGPFLGGPTAAVAMIEDGCPTAVVTGLPSTRDALGGILGADDVAFLGGDLYVAVDGGGPVHGNPDQPSGVYRVGEDGDAELVADFSAWMRENPVDHPPADDDPDAGAYRMVADEDAGALWVVEPNNGQVVSVTPDGEITRIADLSEGHPVPSAIAAAPEGGVYIGNLTAVPFPDGAAKVIHVAEDGTTHDVWTGLTTVVDVAVGDDGTLYALEMSTGNLDEPPFLTFGTGRVVRQTGDDSLEVVAEGFMLPIALEIGPEDGSFYVAMPAIGADQGNGTIVRLEGGMNGSPAAEAEDAESEAVPADCQPIPETVSPPHAPATPEAATPSA